MNKTYIRHLCRNTVVSSVLSARPVGTLIRKANIQHPTYCSNHIAKTYKGKKDKNMSKHPGWPRRPVCKSLRQTPLSKQGFNWKATMRTSCAHELFGLPTAPSAPSSVEQRAVPVQCYNQRSTCRSRSRYAQQWWSLDPLASGAEDVTRTRRS